MSAQLVLALMLWLVPPKVHELHGEMDHEVRGRYETIATAIAGVSPESETLVLYLLTVARHESGFDKRVHMGKVRGDQGRSWGLFQVMVGRHATDRIPRHRLKWRAGHLVGLDTVSTWRAVVTAAWMLGPIIEGCRNNPTCVFKTYGGVPDGPMKPKTKARILARVSTLRKLRAKLAADEGGEP